MGVHRRRAAGPRRAGPPIRSRRSGLPRLARRRGSQEIEADQARQAELDQARGQEILRKLTEEDSSVATPAQNLAPVQDGKLDELKNVEREAENDAAQKVAESEQARIVAEQRSEPNSQKGSKGAEPGAGETRQAEPLGLVVELGGAKAEQAATEAAKQVEAAE